MSHTDRRAAQSPYRSGIDSTNRPIRILTWNLWWRFGPWPRRRAAILEVLLDAGPDICGLQEVPADDEHDLAAELADALGMHWAWLPSPEPERWHSRLPGCTAAAGNVILSRWPLEEGFDLSLPAGSSGDGSRTAIARVVSSPDGRIPVAATQLTAAPWDSSTRCTQVRTLVERLGGIDQSRYPVVLVGDMNAEPDSDEIRLLCGHKTAPAHERFVLVDAWRYAPEAAPSPTWDRANPHVAATMEPSARIDYVLVGPPRSGRRGHVLSARRVGAEPVRGVWPSDHAGVLVELETGTPAPAA
jgi:endonuclease/exonuclease/phosphatase family metal-dependent hydrolase